MTSQTTRSPLPVAAGLVELEVGEMTCASCAERIEKKLNKLDGVTATVNFATEKARVEFPASVTPDDLIAAVEQVSHTARIPAPPAAEPAGTATEDGDEAALRRLRWRLWISLVLGRLVMRLAGRGG